MLPHISVLLDNLKARGNRMTTTRRELATILSRQEQPISVKELLKKLQAKKITANKTTIYRQLELLKRYRVIREVRFDDRTIRYELVHDDDGHHHHLVCVRCGTIDDISFDDDLRRREATIAASKRFKVLRHSLEFFGLCRKCQQYARRYPS